MVDWKSLSVLALCELILGKMSLFIFGAYSWHLLTTLHYVEIPLVTKKLQWHWAYLYYFGARYATLMCQIIFEFPFTQGGFEIVAFSGSFAAVCASGNLLVRSVTMWRRNRPVVIFLLFVGFGHWVTMVSVVVIPIIAGGGDYAPTSAARGPIGVQRGSAIPLYVFTVIVDFITFVFTVGGLLRESAAQASPLWKRLYAQGLIYFLVTTLVNIPMLVLNLLDLNVAMSALLSGPSIAISVVASSRAVTSLLSLKRLSPSLESSGYIQGTEERLEPNLLTSNINLPSSIPQISEYSILKTPPPAIQLRRMQSTDLEVDISSNVDERKYPVVVLPGPSLQDLFRHV